MDVIAVALAKNNSREIKEIVNADKSINALDPLKILDGYYLTGTGLVAAAGYFVTDYIPIENGDIVRYPFNSAMGTNATVKIYDSNKNFLIHYGATAVDNVHTVAINTVGAAFARLSFTKANLNITMVTVNAEYPTEFIPFEQKKYLVNDIYLSETQLEQVQSLTVLNSLYDKTVLFDGDSICAGEGFAGGYAKIIAERNGMPYTNYGVSGGTITAEQYSNEIPKHWVSRSIDTMSATADFVILEGGVNDASRGVPMGVITTGYTATLDDTTFCGAFESMLKKSLLKWQGKKVGFVITHRMSSSFETYYQNMIQMLEKWGVPYCDLYKTAPPLGYIDALKTAFTHNADGWHPNEAGYRSFYCDKIEFFMRSL